MSRKMKLTVLALLLILSCVLYIWKKNKIDLMVDDLNLLQRKERELKAQTREIEIEIERLSRSERIKRIATDELNMHSPDPETLTVKLDEEI